MGMKFERYIDADPVDMQMLGEDFGKLAILTADRSLSFHAPYGHHHTIRIPSFGRALSYEQTTCDLLVPASAGQVYRFDLEEGRFKSPFNCTSGGTCIAVSPTHPLSAVGCEDGIVRCFDNRVSEQKPIAAIDIAAATDGMGFHNPDDLMSSLPGELTSIHIDSAGMNMVCGTKSGCVPLYDMRSSKPLHIKEHQNGLPIHTVLFHKGSNSVISSDAKLIKIWHVNHSQVGEVIANIESKVNLTHLTVSGDTKDPSAHNSGLLLCASEDPRMQAYYCPALGAAPRWCSFLDTITEELEEENLVRQAQGLDDANSNSNQPTIQSVYEDYKFVSREEVENLGISNLVGTNLLRAYMHGYFISASLYSKVRAVANPFEYEQYRKRKIKQQIEDKQASRISAKFSKRARDRLVPKVNADFAQRLNEKAKATKNEVAASAKSVLSDARFSLLFQNPDFHIDENDFDYKLRNASSVANRTHTIANLSKTDHVDDNNQNDDEESFNSMYDESYNSHGGESSNSQGDESDPKGLAKKKKKITFEALDDDDAFHNGAKNTIQNTRPNKLEDYIKDSKRLKQLPLEQRLGKQDLQKPELEIRSKGNSRSITYVPKADNGKISKKGRRSQNRSK